MANTTTIDHRGLQTFLNSPRSTESDGAPLRSINPWAHEALSEHFGDFHDRRLPNCNPYSARMADSTAKAGRMSPAWLCPIGLTDDFGLLTRTLF